MSLTHTYDGSTLSTVLPASVQIVEVAENGQAGQGHVVIDDAAGSQGIVGLKDFHMTESTAPSNNQRVCSALVWDRTYKRTDQNVLNPVGSGRVIDVDLQDQNILLNRRIITGTDGNRPAESVSARLTWLLGSSYATFSDEGLVVYPTSSVDATDFRGQRAGDVISSCAIAANFNYWLYYDEASGNTALFFDDSKTSTAYTSTYKISNGTDADGSTIFSASEDATLNTTPEYLASGMYVPYNGGAIFSSNATTATNFGGGWDQTAPNANVKTSAAATTLASQLLGQDSQETDRITCSIWVKAANVNAIRAGHRIQAKFSHFTDYTSYTYFRVMRRTLTQWTGTDADWQIDLELSPMTVVVSVGCGDPGNVDLNLAHGTVTDYHVNGSKTIITTHGTPSNLNDGDNTTKSGSANELIDPADTSGMASGWHSDLGSAYTVACMDWYTDSAVIGTSPIPDTIEYSTDDSTWHSVSFTFLVHTPDIHFGRFLFSTSITARYWRIYSTVGSAHNLPYGFGYWPGSAGSTWTINGQ